MEQRNHHINPSTKVVLFRHNRKELTLKLIVMATEHFTTYSWMYDELGLSGGLELTLFSLLYSYSIHGKTYFGSLEDLAAKFHKTRQTISNALNSLSEYVETKQNPNIAGNHKTYSIKEDVLEKVKKFDICSEDECKKTLHLNVKEFNGECKKIRHSNNNKNNNKINNYLNPSMGEEINKEDENIKATKEKEEKERVFKEQMEGKFPNIWKMKHPLTRGEFDTLCEKFGYSFSVYPCLLQCENNGEITSNYESAYEMLFSLLSSNSEQ